ncbi:MAG: ImmA/IrrE family metallo-endopeptidase [Lachnospiraceae bacterium]|nr:ImmA/IrrE family metallo-endopeptidase [Lachnospiraceae bacterium]
MGVALIPYSEYEGDELKLLIKRSTLGFFAKATKLTPPTIFYNDSIESDGAVRFTIFHELKHYVFEDDNEEDDDLADFFARYFMCPIPYLLLKKIDSQNEIVSFCGASLKAAKNASTNIINRRNKYGYKLFDYEVRLIEHLEPPCNDIFSTDRD